MAGESGAVRPGSAEDAEAPARESAGKRLAKRYARLLASSGWTREHFRGVNVVQGFDDLKRDLYDELAAWSRVADSGVSRGERRESKRVAWAIGNALADMREDRRVIYDVAANREAPVAAPDAGRLARTIDWYVGLFSMTSGSTHVRAGIALGALDRLGLRLVQLEITDPIGRTRAPATRDPATGDRDVRRESALEGSSVDSVSESESENANEVEGEAAAVRTTRPGASGTRTRARDGWDDCGEP